MSEEFTNDVNLERPVPEQTVEEIKKDPEGLTNREALEKAIEQHTEERKPEAPTNQQVAQAVQAEPEPPSEFSAAGKQAWRSKDITGIQKEFRRIHDSRTAEISRAQKAEREAREEGKTWRDLGKMAAPYIAARGQEGVPPEKAIMEALALVQEMKGGDPIAVKAELKKLGIDLDKAPTQQTAALPKELQDEIESLRAFKNEYSSDKQQAQFKQVEQTFGSIFDKLGSQKTRTGESVFPDFERMHLIPSIFSKEEGVTLAHDLGSLTKDAFFQAGVARRFPNATFEDVVREAYIHIGGKVSGEPVKVSTQSNQQHIQKSRRAASATPGRTAPRADSSNLNGKLSNRAALMKALEIHGEN